MIAVCCCCGLECALTNCGINEYWMELIVLVIRILLLMDVCTVYDPDRFDSIRFEREGKGISLGRCHALSGSGSGSSRGLREEFHSSKMMPTQKVLAAAVLPPVGIPEPQRD